MTTNVRTFQRQLREAYDEKVIAQFLELHKSVARTTYNYLATDTRRVGLRYGSPVLTGRFLGSWTLQVGRPDRSVRPPARTGTGPGVDQTIRGRGQSYIEPRLARLEPFDTVFLTNALPYSRRLEFGYSRLKAPRGVVDVTVAAIRQRFSGAL